LLSAVIFTGCGQAPVERKPVPEVKRQQDQPATTQTGEAGPIDRHVARLILTRHARCRMECRHITETEIREILEEGKINYRKSQPPKYALEGYTKEGQHLRVIFAIPKESAGEKNSLVVVTCIELQVEWQCDCK
jgi:hypothetical protein